MQIEGVGKQIYQNIQSKRTQKPGSKLPKDKDEYIPSNSPTRNISLDSIKEKIKSGYYDKDEVTDDISDKLAGLFDRE